MTNLHFKYSKISGICTVVPSFKIKLDDEKEFYCDKDKLEKLKTVVGLNERCVSNKDTTPSDMMYEAAKHLIEGMNIDLNSIDALICVLDNPDYKCPPTACILQGKLNLPNDCMAFDINHGCSGYIYGLSIAYSLVETNCKRVLLLVGDTKTHTINIKDRISAPIFGDGAAATLIERSKSVSESWFVIGTLGSKYNNIIIPSGGARIPYSKEAEIEEKDEYGNIRCLKNFRMNGKKVFDFTMNTVPNNIMETLKFASYDIDMIDYFILHQANKSIILNILSRIGVKDKNKILYKALSCYGNLAVASIPSAISLELNNKLNNNKQNKLLLSGFGVGLSFGSAIIQTESVYLPETFIYKGEENG